MIRQEDLDGVKLVYDAEYIASDEITAQALEVAFSQASQGWGVSREHAVLLNVAQSLRESLKLSTTAEENARLLKGAQMSGGRLKKQIEKLEAQLAKSAALNLAQTVTIDKLVTQLDAARADSVIPENDEMRVDS